jgi:hypothetical protein
MLYVLGPFCPLPLQWGFVAWSVLNLAAIGWLLSRPDCPRILGPLVFLTPTALESFKLGQSAILATAGLVFLGCACVDKLGRRRSHVWIMALVLWALTARPQLAITAGVALLAARQWRPVVIALFLTLATTALITPLMGTRWVADYVHLLGHYDLETAPPEYRWVLVPSHMKNLRALLTMGFGIRDDWSTKVSTGLWLLTLVGVLISSWIRRVPPAIVWGTCVLLQLLLCPHVNSYELVLLYAVLVFFLHADPMPASVRTAAVWFCPLLLWLPPIDGLIGSGLSAVFIGLLIVMMTFIWMYGMALRGKGVQVPLGEPGA